MQGSMPRRAFIIEPFMQGGAAKPQRGRLNLPLLRLHRQVQALYKQRMARADRHKLAARCRETRHTSARGRWADVVESNTALTVYPSPPVTNAAHHARLRRPDEWHGRAQPTKCLEPSAKQPTAACAHKRCAVRFFGHDRTSPLLGDAMRRLPVTPRLAEPWVLFIRRTAPRLASA